MSQSIADDVTMSWELWRYHVNSDIDFIHSDIHGRSCKNLLLPLMAHVARPGDIYQK